LFCLNASRFAPAARFVLTIFAILLSGSVIAQTGAPASRPANHDALFTGHDLLELTLSAPLKKIHRERDSAVSYPGTLSYQKSNDLVSLNVGVEVRGKNRLKRTVCRFPPLRLVFDDERNAGTVFEQQRKLKLVTQCDYSKPYEQYLLNEYLAYRIFNAITPNSFQVRLARVEYTDAEQPAKSRRAFAFFIEHKKNLAKRLNAKSLSIEQSSAVDLDSLHLNQGSLFQLLIGNVDWSATSGGADECCHNYKLFEQADQAVLSIPYDFDLSGLVNAKYAKPDTDMKLETIRERRYRGYCRNNKLLEQNIKLFNDRKAKILGQFEALPYLTAGNKKSGMKYIESFYKIINEPKRVKRVILQRCHKSYFREVPPI
jgi:hypothetical protein